MSGGIKGLAIAAAVGIAVALLVQVGTNLVFVGIVEDLEARALDYPFRQKFAGLSRQGGQTLVEDIVILDVDESSLAQWGRFAQWPRSRHADLMAYLAEAGARAVFFDILFIENDRDSAEDSALVAATEQAGNVFHALYLLHPDSAAYRYPMTSDPLAVLAPQAPWPAETFATEGLIAREVVEHPFNELAAAAHNVASVTAFPDPDGVVRRVPLLQKFRDHVYPTMSLALAAELRGLSPSDIRWDGGETLWLDDTPVPVDDAGRMLVNYIGPYKSFRNIPYWQFQTDPAFYRDKVVMVGTSAAGLGDRYPIPAIPSFPGVSIHANALNTLQTETFLAEASFSLRLGVALFMGLFVGLLTGGLKPLWAGLVTMVVVFAYVLVTLLLAQTSVIWLGMVRPSMVMVGTFSAVFAVRYFTEEKQKRYIKDAFSSYLAPEVVTQLMDDPSRLQLGGDRKIITILFTDLAGFSTVSEALTAEELVILLNEYLTEMCDIIFKYGGTVDKFEGDLIMAFFGAPIEYEDHATKACLASLEMNSKLAEMREVWRKQGRHELRARIGLNTGEAVVGNMGSKQRMDYTVMGDSVNVASRLEGSNKPFGTYLMISADTYEMAKEDIEARQLDYVTVIGRKEPVAIYEVLSRKGELDEERQKVREIYSKAFALYQDQQWADASVLFEEAVAINDDPPSNALMDRCQKIIRGSIEIPQRWDGVWELTEK